MLIYDFAYHYSVILNYLLSLMISVAAALYILPIFFKLLSEKRIIKHNYSGKNLISSMGLAMLFTCLAGILPFIYMENMLESVIFVATATLTAFAGFIDDILADKEIKGIKAHLTAAATGNCHTGWLKILIGTGTGLLVSIYFHKDWKEKLWVKTESTRCS